MLHSMLRPEVVIRKWRLEHYNISHTEGQAEDVHVLSKSTTTNLFFPAKSIDRPSQSHLLVIVGVVVNSQLHCAGPRRRRRTLSVQTRAKGPVRRTRVCILRVMSGGLKLVAQYGPMSG